MKHNYFLLALIIFSVSVFAQSPSDQFWHLAPFSKKGNSGIGLAEAQEMMKDKTPTTVIVAIADAGVDIYHPDLKTMLWTNSKEIADNGIDDDCNGYVDDVHGWNFLGETTFDNMEVTRQYAKLNAKYELKSVENIADKEEYQTYLKLKDVYLKENQEAKLFYDFFFNVKQGLGFLESEYGTDITKEKLKVHKSKSKYEEMAKQVLLGNAKGNKPLDYPTVKKELLEGYDHYDFMYNYAYNASFNPRQEAVGDNYEDVTERFYGNGKVYYGERFSNHGTHVAGIVAADASNDFGAKGICQSCKIMSIRTVPEGDERDKDVANSIRYAADNGAKIVNMSFGKSYASNTKAVHDAIQYAQDHDVLLIHAAGNNGKNNDKSTNYPNDAKDTYINWLEVGASSWQKKPNVLANFSNYGVTEVDLFAPGVAIYSTTPEGNYEAFDGTSMAAPTAAGVAAFVWSYYPKLTAAELKQVLIVSAIPIKGRTKTPGDKKRTRACKVSKSGAEINLPAALKLAKEQSE
jgi:subtilisin family serine protease